MLNLITFCLSTVYASEAVTGRNLQGLGEILELLNGIGNFDDLLSKVDPSAINGLLDQVGGCSGICDSFGAFLGENCDQVVAQCESITQGQAPQGQAPQGPAAPAPAAPTPTQSPGLRGAGTPASEEKAASTPFYQNKTVLIIFTAIALLSVCLAAWYFTRSK